MQRVLVKCIVVAFMVQVKSLRIHGSIAFSSRNCTAHWWRTLMQCIDSVYLWSALAVCIVAVCWPCTRRKLEDRIACFILEKSFIIYLSRTCHMTEHQDLAYTLNYYVSFQNIKHILKGPFTVWLIDQIEEKCFIYATVFEVMLFFFRGNNNA